MYEFTWVPKFPEPSNMSECDQRIGRLSEKVDNIKSQFDTRQEAGTDTDAWRRKAQLASNISHKQLKLLHKWRADQMAGQGDTTISLMAKLLDIATEIEPEDLSDEDKVVMDKCNDRISRYSVAK